VSAAAPGSPDLSAVCALFKDRAATLEELADLATMLWLEPSHLNPDLASELSAHLKPEATPALVDLTKRLADCEWTRTGIAAAIKETISAAGLKMPQLAVPVRLKVFGRAQTPSVDAMLALMPRQTVLDRLSH
jgi:glutamyl-tRNA synthetase